MKFYSTLFLFFAALTFGQNTRFVYQVSMKPDSTNRSEVKTEFAYLDVSPSGSNFYGETRVKRDSLMSKMRANGNFDRSQMQNYRSDINYNIVKDYTSNKVTFHNRIARDLYAYEEDRTLVWNILPETAKIGDYATQKAETLFAGRKWTAWFTQDVPVMDGPYKFKGLPGLIVKIEDAKGDYSFDLMKTIKLPQLSTFNQGNTVKVKRKDYEKQEAAFRQDPASVIMSSVRSGSPRPQSGGQGRGFGMTQDPAQRKAMEQRLKEELSRNNNPLELKN